MLFTLSNFIWIIQNRFRQIGQGVRIIINNFTLEDCVFLDNIFNDKFSLRTSVIIILEVKFN